MADEVITLDPRDTSTTQSEGVAPRPGSLDGKGVGLLSNNKPNSELLLRGVIDLLKEKYSVKEAAKTVTEACGVPVFPVVVRGITLPSQMNRLSTSWDSKYGFTTDVLGSTPARQEPTLC